MEYIRGDKGSERHYSEKTEVEKERVAALPVTHERTQGCKSKEEELSAAALEATAPGQPYQNSRERAERDTRNFTETGKGYGHAGSLESTVRFFKSGHFFLGSSAMIH